MKSKASKFDFSQGHLLHVIPLSRSLPLFLSVSILLAIKKDKKCERKKSRFRGSYSVRHKVVIEVFSTFV